MLKEDLERLSGPRVFGYGRRRKVWVKISIEVNSIRTWWTPLKVQAQIICIPNAPLFLQNYSGVFGNIKTLYSCQVENFE